MPVSRPTGNQVAVSPLIDAAEHFRAVLDEARAAAGPKHFSWYPYDSLGNAVHLTELLQGSSFDLLSAIRGKRILDLGCADGDFAFFLESLGASVVAVDHPRANHNNLAGIEALRTQLGSRIEIRRADLDTGVHMGHDRFELATALGLLYHLRNPLQFLDSLSRCARYCLLSTRIMRRVPGIASDVSSMPVAYLLGADELNADNSNFWIFTEAALRRLMRRAHWRVVEWVSVGNRENSDPHTLENDERAFCLIESTWGEIGVELVRGWHDPEDTGWRWTEKRFSVRARVPAGTRTELAASIYVPDMLLEGRREGLSLEITVNGSDLTPEHFNAPGLFTIERTLPRNQEELLIEFTCSHAVPPDSSDNRERSLIVESIHVTSF